MSEQLTVCVVYADGNPSDIAEFGADAEAAWDRYESERLTRDGRMAVWIIDADDPERGDVTCEVEERTD